MLKKEFASPSALVVAVCVTADGSEERLFELTIKRRRSFLFWLARAVQMSVWSPQLKPLTQTKDSAFNCCAFFCKKFLSTDCKSLLSQGANYTNLCDDAHDDHSKQKGFHCSGRTVISVRDFNVRPKGNLRESHPEMYVNVFRHQ